MAGTTSEPTLRQSATSSVSEIGEKGRKYAQMGLISLDGKTVKASLDRATASSPLHMVSAWCSENGGLVLGQVKTDTKSNEITAIPELLHLLALKGCLVTIDAMGCQTAIARQIRAQEGDYLTKRSTRRSNSTSIHTSNIK